MAVLAVAAISARMLAEAAARDGYGVVALDLFGDLDTRRAVAQWLPIGRDGSLQFDAARVLEALRHVARDVDGGVVGWIPGSGFEGHAELLEAGAQLLPLIGTTADAVRRVRDPRQFFGALAAHAIAHPAVQMDAPADPHGWLLKDAHASGGWHIRDAAAPPRLPARAVQDASHGASEHIAQAPAHGSSQSAVPGAADDAAVGASHDVSHYYQRTMPGMPMSATFIANGSEALLVGFNALRVRSFGAHPHVYCGCIGPVEVPAAVARLVGDAVRLLSAEFGLRGWCSLDFIRDGDAIGVLEVNPRPPASLSLYARRGLIDAQLRACLQGELPRPAAFAAARVGGSEIVYARRPLQLDEAGARRIADWPDAHDLPAAGARFDAGDPVCSLGADAASAAQVEAILEAGRDALLDTLENMSI
jgi:predicted ATP-grasp superfamily ATP-dependent carboligase